MWSTAGYAGHINGSGDVYEVLCSTAGVFMRINQVGVSFGEYASSCAGQLHFEVVRGNFGWYLSIILDESRLEAVLPDAVYIPKGIEAEQVHRSLAVINECSLVPPVSLQGEVLSA